MILSIELPQIISQCNIYEAGKKSEVFRYKEEQVIISTVYSYFPTTYRHSTP